MNLTKELVKQGEKDIQQLLDTFWLNKLANYHNKPKVHNSVINLYGTASAINTLVNNNFINLTNLEKQFIGLYGINIGVKKSKKLIAESNKSSDNFYLGTIKFVNFDSGIGTLMGRHHKILSSNYSEWTQSAILNTLERESTTLLNNSEFSGMQKKFRISLEEKIKQSVESIDVDLTSEKPSMSVEPIIGYNSQKIEIFNILNLLAFYDPVLQSNYEMKLDSVPVILINGPPGTGKSHFIRYIKSYVAQMANAMQIPSYIKSISSAEKSSYQSGSAKNARELFRKFKNPKGVSLICLDEADIILPNKEDSKAESDRTFTSEFMREIQGDGLPYFGNGVIVGATNYVKDVDERIRSRSTSIYLPPPNTPELFGAILKAKIQQYDIFNLVNGDHLDLGAAFLKKRMSTRDMSIFLDSLNGRSKSYHSITFEEMSKRPKKRDPSIIYDKKMILEALKNAV